jgi:hypothetical protein
MKEVTQTKVEKSQEKKPYVRPQLIQHGAVEALTLGSNRGVSGGPIYNTL